MNLFIFPDAVNRNGKGETIKLNVVDGSFYFYHGEDFVCVDTTLLRDGSSSMVVLNTLTDKLYVLYNFRELLEVLDMTPSEMLSTLAQKGFMQIDKSGGKLYVKVFLLAGDYELESDTTDFSKYKHCTADFIHPLDYQYSWTIHQVKGRLEGECLHLSFCMDRSDFWVNPVYISHAGQTQEVHQGQNTVRFKYNPTEQVYLGNPNCRYKGRAIDLARLLSGGD